jgi:hypothetical protein
MLDTVVHVLWSVPDRGQTLFMFDADQEDKSPATAHDEGAGTFHDLTYFFRE